uniref:organic cation transporter protein-like n=1 Tax=Styela clava TaxID=7725 RepID=UPI00193A2AE4|nr:organic cation transporter protein-like [Styela clava]
MIDFDYILSKVGYLGTYQILVILMVYYSGIPSGLNSIGPVFMSYQPDYRCNVPPFDNKSVYNSLNESEILALTTPVDGDGKYDTCRRYSYDVEECYKHGNDSFECLEGVNNTVSCVNADGYYYDRSLFTETVVTEMDLVCDKVIYSYAATSIYMLGLLFGSIIFGNLSDRVGRKPTMIVCSVGCAVGMLGAVLSPVYWAYALFRLIIAFFGYGMTISCFVIVMELIGTKWRTLVGISFQVSFAVGYMLLSGVAYGWRDWRDMQWACIVLSLPFGIFLILIPESPRWLFSVGKDKQAKKISMTMAKFNKVELTEDIWLEAERLGNENVEKSQEDDKNETRSYSSSDLFRAPGIRLTTFKVMFNWFVNSLVYYGLSLNVGSLSGNIFINNVIGGCMEIISYGLCIIFMDFVGRKVLLAIMLLVSGTTLIASTIVNEYAGDDQALITLGVAFAFLGKMGISGSYAIIYNFTTELFPTVVRSNGIGIGSMAARIGGILTPFVIATQVWVTWLPNSIFGAFGVIAGILSLTFPETTGMKMLETLEEAEAFYAGQHMTAEQSDMKEQRLSSADSEEPTHFENKFYEVDLSTEL